MIDLHTHTIFSDGVLLPSELARRGEEIGYSAIAFTDHVDFSNYKFVCENIINVTKKLNSLKSNIKVIAGAEITYVPPEQIEELVKILRKIGLALILVHGETITEPVKKGTNFEAIKAKVDILAHPGLITEEDVKLAKVNNVKLELTSKLGHSYTNGHVVKLAKKYNVQMVLNSDTHTPLQLLTNNLSKNILLGAGLDEKDIDAIYKNSKDLIKKII
jgi:histidinol phosphatase-like PHP family hydrolase